MRALRADAGEERGGALLLDERDKHLYPCAATLAISLDRSLDARLDRVERIERHRTGKAPDGARQSLHEHLLTLRWRTELRHH